MAKRGPVPKPAHELKQRLEIYMHDTDIAILHWLREQEGGNRQRVMSRALDLYCAHVEALAKVVDLDHPAFERIQ